ncbi:MAG: lytic transglycosylase domain-containing protein [Cohaesibacter sp.]|nr:lytic transglycosylase domain-containing protein [Cohaesibacter sp.]
MKKSLNTLAHASVFPILMVGLLAPALTATSAIAQTMPLPKPRPAPAVSYTQTAPIGKNTIGTVIHAANNASDFFPQNLTILPRTKPGLAPLPNASTGAGTIAAKPAAIHVPVNATLPKVASTNNDIAPQRGSLKQALDALSRKKSKTALAIHKGMKRSLDRVILTYILAIGGYRDLSAAEIKAFYDRKRQWPSRSLIAKRIEEAVSRQTSSAPSLARAFGKSIPKSTSAGIEVAIAHAKSGNKKQAARIIAPIWRSNKLSATLEKRILSNLGSVLTRADHKARADYLLYRERANGAVRLKRYLTKGQAALVDARIAVIRRSKTAKSKLNAVPASLRKDPGYIFSKIQYLRRTGQENAAANLMLKAPRTVSKLVNHREWWIERRLLSRIMLNKGQAKTAYSIAANHTAQRAKDVSEAEFHAGFFALRYVKNPKTAAIHFERSWQKASRKRDKSRGLYWQGRAWEAVGNRANAIKFYKAAANPTVYYGQLAMEELGQKTLRLTNPAPATAQQKTTFNGRELVQAVKRLKQVGHAKRAGPILRHLARTLPNASEVALAHQLAQSYSLHQNAVQIGQIALSRGMPADKLAFPLNVIPRSAKTNGVDIALIYALAKQESVFNIAAVSHANARGFMQMLPATAKRTAKKMGVKFSKARMTTDAKYIINLGSYHLKGLLERFNGSYIMTFAAYNAGAGRPPQWVKRFGDPRSRRINTIDWVERIPFTETRDYVKKLTENLQIYEARIHGRKLDISKDLKRGHPD